MVGVVVVGAGSCVWGVGVVGDVGGVGGVGLDVWGGRRNGAAGLV